MTSSSIAERANEAHHALQRLGFRAISIDPRWYESVVIAMLISPGVRTAIDNNAEEVARVLDWQVQHPNRRDSHP